MTRPDLDVLESLLAKATPGPWKIHARSDTAVDGATGHVVAACGGYHNNTRDPGQLHDELASNAALIVATVNALPSLIARVRELERDREAAALAMRERCAKACDDLRTDDLIVSAWEAGRQAAIAECAAAIRALEP